MRKTQSSSRNFFVSTTRFVLLAVCFAVVFSVIIAGGVFDVGANGSGNVAFAVDAGGSALMAGDTELSPANFKFQMNSATSWTLTVKYTNYTDSNVSAHVHGGTSVSAEIASASNNEVFVKSNDYITRTPYVVSGAVNLTTSPFVSTLLQNDNISVKAKATAEIYKGWVGNWSGMGAFGTAQAYDAEAMWGKSAADDRTVGYEACAGSSGDEKWQKFTSETSLTKDYPNLLIAFAMRGTNPMGITRRGEVKMKNLTVTYTVSLKSFSDSASLSIADGASPQVTSFGTTTPYRTSSTSGDWPVSGNLSDTNTNNLINNILKNATDSEFVGAQNPNSISNIKLASYTSTPLQASGIPTHYKSTSVTLTDYMNYFTLGATSGTANTNLASGIKTIKVGDTTFNLYDSALAGDFYVDGAKVGYAKISKTNRVQSTLNLYFYQNATVPVTVTDYGNSSKAFTYTVSGIDTNGGSAPNYSINNNYSTNLSPDGFVSADFFYNLTQSLSASSANVDGVPQLWFFDVKYSATLPSAGDGFYTPNTYVAATLKTKLPFGVGTTVANCKFDYDFQTGKAKLTGQSDYTVPSLSGNAVSGSGYYMFTFYVLDFAGNTGTPVSYLMRVDNGTPDVTFKLAFGEKEILSSANGAWANAILKLTVDLAVNNISGNIIGFTAPKSSGTGNAQYRVFLNSDGEIVKVTIDGAEVADYNSYGNGLALTTQAGNLIVSVDPGDTIIDFATAINVCAGNDINLYENTSSYAHINATDSDWVYQDTKQVALRVDTTAPANPDFGGQIAEFVNGKGADGTVAVPTTWFTDAWNADYYISGFLDDGSAKYSDLIKLYFGVKNFATQEEADSFRAAFESGLASATDYAAFFNGLGFDNNSFIKNAAAYSGTVIANMDFFNTAGLKGVFMFVVDQAGNVSATSIYTLLVDANNYVLLPSIDSEYVEHFSTGLPEFSGYEGSYKRGESVTLSVNLNGFAPYEIFVGTKDTANRIYFQNNSSTSNDLHISYDSHTHFHTNSVVKEGVLNFADQEESNLVYAFGSTGFGALGTPGEDGNITASLIFTFRKPETATISGNSFDYTGEPVVMTFTAGSLEQYLEMAFYARQTEDAEEIERPVNAGTYYVTLRFKDEYSNYTKFYVNTIPIRKTAFNIKKISLTIKASGTSVYGFAVGGTVEGGHDSHLTFEISGFVEADRQLWEAGKESEIAGYVPGVYKIKDPVIKNNYVQVGSYAIARESNAQFTNYIPVYDEGKGYVITQRKVTVTASDTTKVYGDADPVVLFTYVVDVSDGNNPSFELGHIFANAVESGDAASVAASAFERVAGENVGRYVYNQAHADVLGFDSANFVLEFNGEGGALVVTQRTIYVKPDEGQTIVRQTDVDGIKFTTYENDTFSVVKAGDAEYLEELKAAGQKAEVEKVVDPDVAYYIRKGTIVGNDNIAVVFDENVTVTVTYDPTKNTITITIKDSALLNAVFGTRFDYETVLAYSADKFDVVETQGEGGSNPITWNPATDTVEWTVDVDGYDRLSPVKAGGYAVTLTVNRMTVGGTEITDIGNCNYNVVLPSLAVNVKPCEITVVPSVNETSKVYGATDAFVFSYEYQGIPEGYSFDEGTVSGRMVRALYGDSGFIRVGAYNDNVNELLEVGQYYGAYVSTALTSTDKNVTLKVDGAALDGIRFTVTPKEVNFDEIDVKGRDKIWTEDNSEVIYNSLSEKQGAMQIAEFVVTGDVHEEGGDIYIDFNGNYVVKQGDAYVEVGHRSSGLWIRFTNIRLEGTKAKNYSLVGSNLVAESDGSYSYVLEGDFKIYINPMNVTKDDFVLTKAYDGSSDINVYEGDFRFSETSQFDSEMYLLHIITTEFPSADALTYSMEIKLIMPYFVATNEIIPGTGVSVAMEEYEGQNWVVITIQDFPAVITPVVIDSNDVTFTYPTERYYNASASVDVQYAVSESVFVAGDTAESIGIVFELTASSPNVSVVGNVVGTVGLSFTKAEITSPNYVFAEGFLDAINESAATKEFKILPIPLNLNIQFHSATFGQTAPTLETAYFYADGKYSFEGLGAQLATFAIKDGATYVYYDIANNKEWRFVQVQNGTDGVTYMHDVKYSNFNLVRVGDYSGVSASNFTLNGKILSIDFASAREGTLAQAAELLPRSVEITINDLKVENKVYDGTKSATIAPVNFGAIVGTDYGKYLAISCFVEFTSANVGTYRNLSARDIAIGLRPEYASDATAQGVQNSFTFEIKDKVISGLSASITPAPLTVELSLPDKNYTGRTYDGITYKGYYDNGKGYVLSGFVTDADKALYGIEVYAAAYDTLSGANGKAGTAYGKGFGISLTTKSVCNYEITQFASSVKLGQGYTLVKEEDGKFIYELAQSTLYAVSSVNAADKASVVAVAANGEYLLSAKPSSGTSQERKLNTVTAVGNIVPVKVVFTVAVNGTGGMYEKSYDDSLFVNFNDEDFTLTLQGNYGFVIGSYTVMFDTPDVGTNKSLQFTVTSLKVMTASGEFVTVDSSNYTVESVLIRNKGTITPVELDVVMNPASADNAFHYTYGGTGTYSYKLVYNGVEIIVDAAGYGYMDAADYATAFNMAAVPVGRLYSYENGTFVYDDAGNYVRLSGTFGKVTVLTQAGSKSPVGTYTIDGVEGTATNFVYTYAQSGVGIVVDKADLTVSFVAKTDAPSGYGALVEYGNTTLPAMQFAYSGFVAGDSAKTVTITAPAFGLYFFDGSAYNRVADNRPTKITDDLVAGQYYAFKVQIDPEASYAANYNLVENTSAVCKVFVELPVLSGLSLSDKAPSLVYNGTVNDRDFAFSVINGLKEEYTDEYVFNINWTQGVETVTSAKDVGTYGFVIEVVRRFDENYNISAVVEAGTLTVTPRTLTISVGATFTYTGNELYIDMDSLVFDGVVAGEEESVYNALQIALADGATAMVNAGDYDVTMLYDPAAAPLNNYQVIDKVSGKVTVGRAVITITGVENKKHNYVEGATYGVNYTYVAPEGVPGFNASKLSVEYSANGNKYTSVTQTGEYNYNIVYADNNFTVSGGSGIMIVVMSSVQAKDDNNVNATINLGGETTVPYKLTYLEIYQSGNANTSKDATWADAQASVDNTVKADNQKATLGGYVEIKLTNGFKQVYTTGNAVTMSVRIPAAVADMENCKVYYVNNAKQLVEITDYEVVNGYIYYTTEYLGDLLFVRIENLNLLAGLPYWIWALIIIAGVLVLLAIILAIVAAKKHKSKEPDPIVVTEDLAADYAGDMSDVETIEESVPVNEAPAAPPVSDRPRVVGKKKKPPIIGIR